MLLISCSITTLLWISVQFWSNTFDNECSSLVNLTLPQNLLPFVLVFLTLYGYKNLHLTVIASLSLANFNREGCCLYIVVLETYINNYFWLWYPHIDKYLIQNQLAYLTHHLDNEGRLQQQKQLSQLRQPDLCTHMCRLELASTSLPKSGSDGGLLASDSAANDGATSLVSRGHERRSKSKRKVCKYNQFQSCSLLFPVLSIIFCIEPTKLAQLKIYCISIACKLN